VFSLFYSGRVAYAQSINTKKVQQLDTLRRTGQVVTCRAKCNSDLTKITFYIKCGLFDNNNGLLNRALVAKDYYIVTLA